jgi:hydroxymethylbilane synthase
MLRAATRASALARCQTGIVAGLLAEACGVATEPVAVSTTGDRQADTPIHAMGGKGMFVKEVQAAVLDGRADIAVHSAKDLPSSTPEGLVLAAVPRRGDPRDALVGCRLADLPSGATVATGSVRRKAQLAHQRPDLSFAELRGNIATRLETAAGFDAIVMAAVALQRLGLEPDVVDMLDPEDFVPQAGQGAIAVECRDTDRETLTLLSAIEHRPSRRAVDAERAFLAELGGDCSLPAGAHATNPGGGVELTGLLASIDGSRLVRDSRLGRDPETLGRSVARHLLDDRGGRELLRESADR